MAGSASIRIRLDIAPCACTGDWDGVTRQVQRQAKTKGAAERALAVALRDRGRAGTGHEITSDTKIADLAEKWFRELEGKSPSTLQAYRDRLYPQGPPGPGERRGG